MVECCGDTSIGAEAYSPSTLHISLGASTDSTCLCSCMCSCVNMCSHAVQLLPKQAMHRCWRGSNRGAKYVARVAHGHLVARRGGNRDAEWDVHPRVIPSCVHIHTAVQASIKPVTWSGATTDAY